MLSVGDKRKLDDGGHTFATCPTITKRPKVSAVRQFPSHCGLVGVTINVPENEVEVPSEKLGESFKDVESVEELGSHRHLNGGESPEKIVESSSISDMAAFSQEKSKNVKQGGEESQKLPVDQASNGLLKEPINETQKSSLDMQKIDEKSSTIHETLGTCDELLEVRVGSPMVPAVKDGYHIQSEVGTEGTSMQLQHYQIPSALVPAECKYPLLRRVPAACDFSSGCGQQLSEAVDKHFGQDENNVNAIKEVACLNEVSSSFEVGDSSHTEMELVVCGKTEEVNIQVSQAQKEICKVKEGDHYERLMETRICNGEDEENRRRSRGGTDENEVYLEVKHNNSSCDPFSVKKENITSNVLNELNSVVLGLMAAANCSWRNGRGTAKSVSSMSNVKQNSRKNHGYAREDLPNCVLNKSLDNVEHLEGRSNVTPICPENITSNVVNELNSVVLGLMAAPNCPWRNGKETAKSVSSMSNVKQNSRKKHGYAREDQPNCVLNKSIDNVENLEGRSNAIVPYLKETETEVCGISNDEGSSENEDLPNDFVLMPRGRIDVILLPSNPGSDAGVCRNAREILSLFRSVVRKLLQGEEIINKVGKLKDPENASKRIDLLAADILKASGKCVITGKRGTLGPIPGVQVGDFFHYRMELLITNLHRPLQGGIDFLRQGEKNIAISIVASGGYDNDLDYSDVLIYTGQGGNPKGDKQPEDQKLERGNLALKNSIDEKNVVRVIQGFKETKSSGTAGGRSKTITTYTYDGLYTVEKYWPDVGPCGNLVYKFELRRIPGQPELVWKEVKRSKKFSVRKGRCVDDISEGKEAIPICAVNTIDDEKPPPFTYITSMIYPDWCQPIPPRGCDCKDGCSDSNRCACAVKNGGGIPYNFDGAIIEAKRLVYECGPTCKCPPSCRNRVTQHGIKIPLEIFKTESRGWGVRSLSSIPSGTFICEYLGELLDDGEADQRTGSDEYLFDIGQNYNDSTLWDGVPALMPNAASGSDDVVEDIGFTIDAANFGNIGRFVNHSCSPNLYAQNVLYDHDDERIPHVMLFATENIRPLQELSYHYNYEIDKVFDCDGNIKRKSCHCGSEECSGRMY